MTRHQRVIADRSNMPPRPPSPPTRKPRPRGTPEDDATMQWLADAPARSEHAIEMIVGGSAPPTPDTDFQRALQAAFDEGRVLHLHAPLTLDAPVAVKINYSNQGWFGFDGGMNKIHSNVEGQPALRFYMDESVPQGTCARGMMLKDFSIIGGGKGGGLQCDIPFNDRWLGNLELRSLWFEGIAGKAGCTIAGSIFESFGYNVGTMDCEGAGMYFANVGPDGNKGIVSAWRLFGGTHRQNGGNGILMDQYDGPADVRMFGLYFCSNAKEGISTISGLELVDGCGFENNGNAGIYLQNFATLRNCSGSTYGVQAYLVDAYLVNPLQLHSCGVVGYGGGAPKLAKLQGDSVVTLSSSGDGSDCEVSGDGIQLQIVQTAPAT